MAYTVSFIDGGEVVTVSAPQKGSRLMKVMQIAAVLLGATILVASIVSTAEAGELNPYFRIRWWSRDTEWLEKIASSRSAAAELEAPGVGGLRAEALRAFAYARLGQLGTSSSLAAAKRVEGKARKVVPAPELVPLSIWPRPSLRWAARKVEPLVQVKADDGTTYALVLSATMGYHDLFLTSSKTPDDENSWTRPKLIPNRIYPSFDNPLLTVRDPGLLVFSFVQKEPLQQDLVDTAEGRPRPTSLGPQRWELSIEEILRDSDSDGWTDIEEARLGLDPGNSDSDGDGVHDGKDTCPDYRPSVSDGLDEDVQIIQKALFANFGLTGSRYLLLVREGSRPVQLWGYRGTVLYQQDLEKWPREHQPGAFYVHWEVTKKSRGRAVVRISEYVGPLAAGSLKIRLRRIGTDWFVVGIEYGPVS